LLAIHTNMLGAVPNDINGAAFTGASAPSGLAPTNNMLSIG
jgi:hypothetical protein